MAIFISSGAFEGVRNTDELLASCRENGVEKVELASGLAPGSDGWKTRLKEAGNSMTFRIHNYFPAPADPFVLNLADADEGNRLRSVRFCKHAMGLCADLEIPYYSVHAGFVKSMLPAQLGKPELQNFSIEPAAYERAERLFLDSIGELSEAGRQIDVDLLIENNVDGRSSQGLSHLLWVSPEDIERFFANDVPENVGLLLDVAHLSVSAAYLKFDLSNAIERLAPWIKVLHLSDNDGLRDSNQLSSEDSWFWEPLRGCCPGGVDAVVESYRIPPAKIREQRELVASMLPQAA